MLNLERKMNLKKIINLGVPNVSTCRKEKCVFQSVLTLFFA